MIICSQFPKSQLLASRIASFTLLILMCKICPFNKVPVWLVLVLYFHPWLDCTAHVCSKVHDPPIFAVSHLAGSRPSTASCTPTPTGVQRPNLATKTESLGANLLNQLSTVWIQFHLSGKYFTLVTWATPFTQRALTARPFSARVDVWCLDRTFLKSRAIWKWKMNVNHRVRSMKKEILLFAA